MPEYIGQMTELEALRFIANALQNGAGSGGAATTPGGSSGDIQTNNAGAFGGLTPGAGVATFLATPSSANLRGALTDELGTGALIFNGANVAFGTGSFTTLSASDSGSVATPAVYIGGVNGTGFYKIGTNRIGYASSGTAWLSISNTNLLLSSGVPLAWSSTTASGTADTSFSRDSAGVIRLGGSATTTDTALLIPALYTDASNYHYGSLAMSDTAFTVTPVTAGTGVDNLNLVLGTAGTGVIQLIINGVTYYPHDSAGVLTFNTTP